MRRKSFLLALFVLALASCSQDDATPERADIPRIVEVRAGEVTFFLKPEAVDLADDAGYVLRDVVAEAGQRVNELLDSPETEVYIQVDADRAIDEVGVGGRTDPREGNVLISLERSFDDVERMFEAALPQTIAHELHHSKRILDGPGYGRTIGETVVTEGLATLFEQEAFPGSSMPWAGALTPAEMPRVERLFRRKIDTRSSQRRYAEWFFGEGELPRWAGYALGHAIANAYTDGTGQTAASLATVPAKKLLTFDSNPS